MLMAKRYAFKISGAGIDASRKGVTTAAIAADERYCNASCGQNRQTALDILEPSSPHPFAAAEQLKERHGMCRPNTVCIADNE